MVEPEPTYPVPYGTPSDGSPSDGTQPYLDPWALTAPVTDSPAGPPPPAAPQSTAALPTAALPTAALPTAPPTPVSGPGYPPAVTYPYPGLAPTQPAYGAGEPTIMQIGEIQVTATTVRTPAGTFPLRGSQWTVTDQWMTEQKVPTWAIVLAIVLFFCVTVFSLLFLLARETRHHAVVQVQVISGPYQYVARIPAGDPGQVQYLYQQVNYVRSLAAG